MIIVERKSFSVGEEEPEVLLQEYLNQRWRNHRVINVQFITDLYMTAADCAEGKRSAAQFLIVWSTDI